MLNKRSPTRDIHHKLFLQLVPFQFKSLIMQNTNEEIHIGKIVQHWKYLSKISKFYVENKCHISLAYKVPEKIFIQLVTTQFHAFITNNTNECICVL